MCICADDYDVAEENDLIYMCNYAYEVCKLQKMGNGIQLEVWPSCRTCNEKSRTNKLTTKKQSLSSLNLRMRCITGLCMYGQDEKIFQ